MFCREIMNFANDESEVAQWCSTLWDPVDCSPPGSSIHRILQARILKWVAISFSGESSGRRDRTQVSRTAGRGFNLWATRADSESHYPKAWLPRCFTCIISNSKSLKNFPWKTPANKTKGVFRITFSLHLRTSVSIKGAWYSICIQDSTRWGDRWPGLCSHSSTY